MRKAKNSAPQSPLSFEIDAHLHSAVSDLRSQLGDCPLSAVVVYALENFDFEKLELNAGGDRHQVSVRLDTGLRKRLQRISKSEKISTAYLIRLALEELLDAARHKQVLTKIKNDMSATKTAPAKKAPAKKAVAKKAPAKKAAAPKAPAKKAVVKKAPAKKVAVKKAPAKKVAAKKAPKALAAPKAPAKKAAVKKAPAKKVVAKKAPAPKAAAPKAPAKKAAVKKAPAKKVVAKKAPAKKAAVKKA
jgi:predicted transcriptional regulator